MTPIFFRENQQLLQRPELDPLSVRQPGMDDALFVQEFRSATYETFECSNLPPGASSRERLCVQYRLDALQSCFGNGCDAFGAQAYTQTLGSTVFQAAVLWGRLFSYVARAIDSLLPVLDQSKPFPVEVLQSDEVYANSLFECLRKTSTKRKHDRAPKRMWSCTDEMFHFTRGVEWFLDMHASVYNTGSHFRDDNKLLVASVKHLYPSTFRQTWEHCSFEPCVPPSKLRITRPRDSVQWESLRRAHVDYHLLFLQGECNRLVASKSMRRNRRAEETEAGESDGSEDEEDSNGPRSMNRAIIAAFNQSTEQSVEVEDVDSKTREEWFSTNSSRRSAMLEKLGVQFDDEDNIDVKFLDPDDKDKTVFGEKWLSEKKRQADAVVESEQAKNDSQDIRERKMRVLENTVVTEEDRLWFQEIFDIGVDKAKDMESSAMVKTAELVKAEWQAMYFQAKIGEYTKVRTEVMRLYNILNQQRDPFEQHDPSNHDSFGGRKYKLVEPADSNVFMKGEEVTLIKTALRKLFDAINQLGLVWEDETQRGIDFTTKQSETRRGIVNAMKASTSIIDRLYTITFGLTSPTTVLVKDTKFNLFTATPSQNLSTKYAEIRNYVKAIFDTLAGYKSTSNPRFSKPSKFIIDFQVEKDEFFDKLNQALVSRKVSARAVQRASDRNRNTATPGANVSNSTSTKVPVYFYMGSMPLTTEKVTGMTVEDKDILMALDSVLVHQNNRGTTTTVGENLQWFKRIGADTGATVNQAWVVETMNEQATSKLSPDPAFILLKTLSTRIECDGVETETAYKTDGLAFLDDAWRRSTGITTPKVSRMVFRFPQDSERADTMKDALETIMQYTYASSQLVGAKVGAIYVFSPDRLGGTPTRGKEWSVMIVMERMDVNIIRNEKLGKLKRENEVAYNSYVESESAYLSRLWVLIARMSAAGIAFMDSHGDNIMAVPSKYGGFAPRLVDFDNRWGCVLSRADLVPTVLERPENEEALRTHPGWRPLYILNILFIAFQLRIDDTRARVFDKWMSIATSVSNNDSKASSVQALVNQRGKSKTVDRETHIRILIANELEYLKSNTIREHFNVAHRVLDTKWKGGFWGGVDLVLRPGVDDDLKHNAALAYQKVDDDFMNTPTFEWQSETKQNPFYPNLLENEHTKLQLLVWGATVKIFDNGFKGLNSRQNRATVHAKMIARQSIINEARMPSSTTQANDVMHNLNTSEFMGIVGRLSMLGRQASLESDTFVKKNASRIFRRLNHFFRKRDGDYNILELLYEFSMAAPISLPLPPSMTRDDAGAVLSDDVMNPVTRVSDVKAHTASQMKF